MDILVLRLPRPGYEPAVGEEWQEFLRQNLYADIGKYGNATARRVTLSALHTLMHRLTSRNYLKTHAGLVVLRRGRAYLACHRNTHAYIKTRIKRNLERLVKGAAALGLALPDTVFAYSAQDEPVCKDLAGACSGAPVFSHIKRYDRRERKAIDSDVLIPHLGHSFKSTVHFPWPAKDPRAVMRASLQNTMDPKRCMRTHLARLSASSNGSAYLDCGYVANNHRTYKIPKSHMKSYIGMSRHSHYRLVMNADGHTASSRLGYLLTVNSAVLTQGDSPWIEYYYRSLQPGRHLLTYDASSVLPLVREMQVRYWVAALQAYADLAPPALARVAADMTGLSGGSSRRLGRASTSTILSAIKRAAGGGGSSSKKSSKRSSSHRRSTKTFKATGGSSAQARKALAEVVGRLDSRTKGS
ncbi:hypothetical protein HYH02_012569 [Chlamydomonas schloesseri]|uniref:Glycosyl transferase CAP10 domain-containing protein n=1 Tax=Chlamydomonas schloesseri TaxID=2026947 RepID=A0A835T8R7_9CHLO|nr:hypothetical protein HYH02_012569 [Chlamydomonas schloesseri]|eukprot:KAG2433641.1 hypothetical protein HYH02_012569 [Chlamydomonas schloesseri]